MKKKQLQRAEDRCPKCNRYGRVCFNMFWGVFKYFCTRCFVEWGKPE